MSSNQAVVHLNKTRNSIAKVLKKSLNQKVQRLNNSLKPLKLKFLLTRIVMKNSAMGRITKKRWKMKCLKVMNQKMIARHLREIKVISKVRSSN